MTKYFSQNRQDEFLNKYIFRNKRNGVFVDIGAHDGIAYSNSLYFEKFLGWQGICVEANPAVYNRLVQNRKSINLNICISETEGVVDFLQIEGYGEMLSGIVDHYPSQHVDRINSTIKTEKVSSKIIPVNSSPLNTVLENHQYNHIDYLSIDTEGSELNILKTIDLEKFPVHVISIENNYQTSGIEDYLSQYNYKKVVRLGEDDIYLKKTRFADDFFIGFGKLTFNFNNRLGLLKQQFQKPKV